MNEYDAVYPWLITTWTEPRSNIKRDIWTSRIGEERRGSCDSNCNCNCKDDEARQAVAVPPSWVPSQSMNSTVVRGTRSGRGWGPTRTNSDQQTGVCCVHPLSNAMQCKPGCSSHCVASPSPLSLSLSELKGASALTLPFPLKTELALYSTDWHYNTYSSLSRDAQLTNLGFLTGAIHYY
jgi:hypothetical protein